MIRSVFVALFILASSLAASPARAQLGVGLDPEVVLRTEAARTVPARQAYAELRWLWHRWERVDPSTIEAALSALAGDRRVDAPVRVYAGLLEAYARRRRGDLVGAKARIAELGYVSDWLVVGPFPNDNRTGLTSSELVEQELDEPIVFDRSYPGKERAVHWRPGGDIHRYGYLDLGALVRPQRDVCAYAATFVDVPKRRDLTLWVGATGAVRVWFDDELALEDPGYRQLDADRRAAAVRAEAGTHRITVKVCADEAAPAVTLRLGDERGAPITGLTIRASEEASTAAAQLDRKTGAVTKARVRGPLDAFEEAVARDGDRASAELRAAYADYLTITGGEDEAEHLARDLAQKAAEQSPTVDRLLLAARLAEDRNGQRRFLDRAQPLAKTRDERVEVALARARWLRSGPNPRDAFGFYADVLQLSPYDVEAVLGEVDLYVEAGLPRTALQTLTRAVEARPRSVSLLRVLAGQLRALGREADASEVEARYAAFRFDDGGFLQDQLELAVARRDEVGARRWAARLLDAEPTSGWARTTVAQALLALGDREGAVATYRAQLAIAPDDVATMRALADVHGSFGEKAQQVALLQRILRVTPQAKAVRAYLEHIAPSGERQDERYAWAPEKFLAMRAVTDDEHQRRTLRRLTVTTVFDNGLANHFKQIVFQPLTEEAATRSRSYAFVYHADRQVVTLRSAKVYRQDGRVDEAIESGEGPANDPSINMYTLQRTFYVQFPRLEPGDVVELQYRIEDVAVRNEMSDYFGEVEYLQDTTPLGDVEYVLIAPKDKKLHLSVGPGKSPLKGLDHEVTERGDQVVHRYHAEDVPPLHTEPRMPRFGELLAHVHVSTFADWTEVGSWYHTLARDKMDSDESVRRLAQELVKGKTTVEEKVAAIYGYAAGEIRYVALELGIEGIRPRRSALTLARGWGDCKDKATLIVSMLREVGIDAQIVLVRTGLRGDFDPETASLAPFDHAIAYVPSLDLYLDGTAEDTGTQELPAMDRGSLALRVDEGKGRLVHLPEPPAEASTDDRAFQLRLAKTGSVRFSGTLENQGVDAPSWRRRYQAASTQRERISTDLASAFGGPVELGDGRAGLRVSGIEAIEKPVRLEVEGEFAAEKEGAGFSVPMGPAWSLVRSFASQGGARRHDLLVGPQRVRDETRTLAVPAGMKVVSLPKATKLATPFGTFVLEVTQKGQSVSVRSMLKLSKTRIAPREYAAWRAFCQAVDAASAARIVVAPK